MRWVILLSFLLLAAPLARGQGFVTGTVLDPSGVGLAGCNLDFFFAGSGSEQTNVSGDLTGAGGVFLATIPAGTYDMLAWPPAGFPARPEWTFGVVVANAAVTNVGTIQLDPAYLLSGTVTNSTGFPVSGVNIDVEDAATGEDLLISGDNTGLTGTFLIAVPVGTTLNVLFKPSTLIFPLLAPKGIFGLTPCVNTNLGTVALAPGFVLSATVFANGFPLANADIDVHPAGGGPKLYTPGDNSSALGLVDVVVPTGTYDVEFNPPIGPPFVSQVLAGVVVGGNLSLGVVTLPTGFFLTGTVTGPLGQPLAGVDIDVEVPLTGADIPTPNDNTNVLGQYQVVVPAGTYDVDFDPAPFAPVQGLENQNVVVAGNTTLNAMLPASTCTAPSHYGTPTPGTGGFAPTLETNDFARLGSTFRVDFVNVRGGTFGALALGAAPTSIPLLGGTLLVSPVPILLSFNASFTGPASVPCVGSASFPFPIPVQPVLVGGSVFFQGLAFDPAAPLGFAWTDGLQVVVCQ
jgi:hypothetical protein